MSRGYPRSRYRPQSNPAAPFQTVLDQLRRQQDAPEGVISRLRGVPAFGWAYPAAEVPPASPIAAAAEMYVAVDIPTTAPKATPRCVEEAVAQELQLSDDLAPADLERIRRRFAYRNHPDRVGPAHKARALQRMTVANVLVDQALKAARARAR
jgi:hypothetical protein